MLAGAGSGPIDPRRLFTPDRQIWTVDRETVLLLGAGRALLLQFAHPLVAAGVVEHSAFARDRLGRLRRTLDMSYALVFGDLDTAQAAVRRMDTVHARDAEGYPAIPARYGRLEWFDGRDLAVYCDHPRLFAKISAVPGVRRHQTGDQEMRATFPPEALEQVASVIRAKRWGGSGRGRPRNLVAAPGQTGTSAAQDRFLHLDPGPGYGPSCARVAK